MLARRVSLFATIAATLVVCSCGGDPRLLNIQIYPTDPNLAHNTSYYVAPGGAVQFALQGWYSNRTVQTIASTSGKWTSTNTSIATVDSNGLVTSAGPLGVTSIVATAGGHKSSVVFGVCNPSAVDCPPPASP